MADDPSSSLTLALQSLRRPYPLGLATAALMATMMLIVPAYIFIAEAIAPRATHAPAIALDLALPLIPGWAVVYGALYLFLILLPFFVLRQQDHLRRTLLAYVAVWLTAYACFFVYPTTAPRPTSVAGTGFAVWGLRFLYAADPPFNCFPSIHVAHSFVSAWACARVHRGVGVVAMLSATLVGVSTLLTKQHYLLDVVAGAALAGVACRVFLSDRPGVPEQDRRMAPVLAAGVASVLALTTLAIWVIYRSRQA